MASGDVLNKYAAKVNLASTALTNLANGSAWQSAVIDNTATRYRDVLLRIASKAQAATSGALEVYAYAALGDASYTDGASGTDSAFAGARKNAVPVGVVVMNGATPVVGPVLSVAAAFGGTLPDKFGFIVVNNSGAQLTNTGGDQVVDYEGVYGAVVP